MLSGRYDPALTESLKALDPAKPLPALWDEFAGLTGVPLLVVRGETTDLLSRGPRPRGRGADATRRSSRCLASASAAAARRRHAGAHRGFVHRADEAQARLPPPRPPAYIRATARGKADGRDGRGAPCRTTGPAGRCGSGTAWRARRSCSGWAHGAAPWRWPRPTRPGRGSPPPTAGPRTPRGRGHPTTGDAIQDRALSEAGGKGLFTKELDIALIDGRHRRRGPFGQGPADALPDEIAHRGLPAARGRPRRLHRARRRDPRRPAGRRRRRLGLAAPPGAAAPAAARPRRAAAARQRGDAAAQGR